MDFKDRLLDKIEGELSLFSFFQVPRMSEYGNGLSLSKTPRPPGARFLNKSKMYDYGFQITARHTNGKIAEDTLQEIYDYLDGLKDVGETDGTYKLIKIEGYTSPNYVDTNDRNEHLYTALFVAELYIYKGES